MVLRLLWFYGFKNYHISISCFQERIDPISKTLKILFNGHSPFVGARLFHKCQTSGLSFSTRIDKQLGNGKIANGKDHNKNMNNIQW